MALELPKETSQKLLSSIKQFMAEEFEEDTGDLKARLLLNFFLKEIGPSIYNKGVQDADFYMRNKLEDLQSTCYEFEMTYWENRKD
jgi:uncharacterized protein (DUF2164 family)